MTPRRDAFRKFPVPVAGAVAAGLVATLALVAHRTAPADAAGPTAAGSPPATASTSPSGKAGDHWRIEVDPGGQARVGAEARSTLRLLPRPETGYKFNREYPVKIRLAAATPNARLAKETLTRTDATSLEDAGALFQVAFTPTAPGSVGLTADLAFSVCSKTTCDLVKEKLAWTVEAR